VDGSLWGRLNAFECSHDLPLFFEFLLFLWGLRVNAAVFAFIIYFFRLLFELPALILDQSNNFY